MIYFGKERFNKEMTLYIEGQVGKIIKDSERIAIDGLYVYQIAKKLKSEYDAKIVYLKLAKEKCYEKLMKKYSFNNINEAIYEFESKEKSKRSLESEKLIELADFIIDANMSKEDVLKEVSTKLNLV